MDDGALGDGDFDEGLEGVVLGGRLRGGGGCRREGGAGRGGWGVLAWVRAWADWYRVVLCRCVCGVVCGRVGAGLGLGLGLGLGSGLGLRSGLGLGSGYRLRSTSVRRCEGVDAGSGVVPVGCRGA